MKWCCMGFEGRFDTAGQRGTAVLVGRNSQGEPEFTLQHRAVDLGEKLTGNEEIAISLVSEIGMRFCPWCGRRLGRFYRRHVDELYRPGFKIEPPEVLLEH